MHAYLIEVVHGARRRDDAELREPTHINCSHHSRKLQLALSIICLYCRVVVDQLLFSRRCCFRLSLTTARGPVPSNAWRQIRQLVKTRFFWVAAFLTSSVRPTHRTFESKLTTNCVLSLRPVDGARRRRALRESDAWTDESYIYLTTSTQRHVWRPSGEHPEVEVSTAAAAPA